MELGVGDWEWRRIPKLELRVRWEEALVVGWSAEGFFAAGLETLAGYLILNPSRVAYRVKCRSMRCGHLAERVGCVAY